jgi:flagellar biosynthesis GTPase FlhF
MSNEQSENTPGVTEVEKVTHSPHTDNIKMLENVVNGIFGEAMKELIPKLNEAKGNMEDFLNKVLDQVDKDRVNVETESNASDDLNQMVKELEEEFKDDKGIPSISIPSDEKENDEEDENEEDENEEDENEEDENDENSEEEEEDSEYEEDENEEDENDENSEEEEEDSEYEEEEDSEYEEEDKEDVFWDTYEDTCQFVVSLNHEPIGYFDNFRRAQSHIQMLYNQFINTHSNLFLRTERSMGKIKVYQKTPYMWFVYSEAVCLDLKIDTVYRFKESV